MIRSDLQPTTRQKLMSVDIRNNYLFCFHFQKLKSKVLSVKLKQEKYSQY